MEARDDQALSKFVLALASLGNVRTVTRKAFPETEYRSIVKALREPPGERRGRSRPRRRCRGSVVERSDGLKERRGPRGGAAEAEVAGARAQKRFHAPFR